MKYVVLGPTASGKTAYAIALAKQISGAVISADSRQVYAGMNIGAAKPQEAWKSAPHSIHTPDMVDGIPHYLLNIATPDSPITLPEWLDAAKIVISQIEQEGRTPIIAGGTMLYIDALVDGYDIPNIEPNETLRSELEAMPAETLYKRLLTADPDALSFIESHNTRRIIRALEVMDATGKKFSQLRTKKTSDNQYIKIGIFSDFDTLRENVRKRAQEMMGMGLEEEKLQLQKTYPNSPLLKTMN